MRIFNGPVAAAAFSRVGQCGENQTFTPSLLFAGVALWGPIMFNECMGGKKELKK